MPQHALQNEPSLNTGSSLASLSIAQTSRAEAVRNLLLASLPREDLARVRRHVETVDVEHREPLFAHPGPVRHVYFPETAVISIVRRLSNGATVEIGTAGCEGMVGLPLFLAGAASPVAAVVQVPGIVSRMNAEAFTLLSRAPGTLHQVLLRYAEAFLSQVAQTAACNARHLVNERCARWLLTTYDRVGGDTFDLTHEFLALMLGVRRAGVSVAMHQLQDEGTIEYGRGEVRVLDRAKLERSACECYRVVRTEFERLLPRPTTVSILPTA